MTQVLDKVAAALASEPSIGPQIHHIKRRLEDGAVLLEGEVSTIAAKKKALEHVAAIAGFDGIIDRLHVTPAAPMGDAEIRAHLRNAVVGEPSFADIDVFERNAGAVETVQRVAAENTQRIEFDVAGGIVTLNGELTGLVSKRLAGVLAWWIPGTRDVINGIAVTPLEQDNQGLVEDAVRVVLEKDPFVNASQIRVGARLQVVQLTGSVRSDAERDMAERDAWCVFGVDDVINKIDVEP